MPAKPVAAKRLGSVKDVAARLDLSERGVWKMLAAGRMIPAIRLGRAVKFDLDVLDRWISAGCPQPASEQAMTVPGGDRVR